MQDSPVNPPSYPQWAGPPTSPPLPPPPAMPVYRTTVRTTDLIAPQTSGAAIFGGFVATAACAFMAFLQMLSSVLGFTFGSVTRDPSTNGDVSFALQAGMYVAWTMVLLAFGLTIAAAANRRRRILGWVFLPLTINTVLCIATWLFAVASIRG